MRLADGQFASANRSTETRPGSGRRTGIFARRRSRNVARRTSFGAGLIFVRHWETLLPAHLESSRQQFADTPIGSRRWPNRRMGRPTRRSKRSKRTRTSDEVAEAYGPVKVNDEEVDAGVTIRGVVELFRTKLEVDAANDEMGRTAAWTTEKNLRCRCVTLNSDHTD